MHHRTVAAAAGLLALAAPLAVAAPATAAPVSPAALSARLISAWQKGNRTAALKVATPAAVRSLFSAPWRTPDRFDGCVENGVQRVCRFDYTSVDPVGGLDAVVTVVRGRKVVKVYVPRLFSAPGPAARHLFAAWRARDRLRALEVASPEAVKRLFWIRHDHRITYRWRGCSRGKSGWTCGYSSKGGTIRMHLRGRPASGYEVRDVALDLVAKAPK